MWFFAISANFETIRLKIQGHNSDKEFSHAIGINILEIRELKARRTNKDRLRNGQTWSNTKVSFSMVENWQALTHRSDSLFLAVANLIDTTNVIAFSWYEHVINIGLTLISILASAQQWDSHVYDQDIRRTDIVVIWQRVRYGEVTRVHMSNPSTRNRSDYFYRDSDDNNSSSTMHML